MAFRSIISATLIVSSVFSGQALAGDGLPATSGMAAAEVERRAARVMEAQELLEQGDAAYESGRYEDAVAAYRGAVDLIPANAAAARELRQAALQRFAQASVERSKEQRRLGDHEGALATVEAVLEDSMAPHDALALEEREMILDPIRTNPAGSREHTADIEEVRLLLYKAQGFHDLGDYDKASVAYEEVLRIDPFNKAARRGMERNAAARSDYARAAYDHARAEMLADVAGGWELEVPPLEDVGELLSGDGTTRQDVGALEMLEQMIVPIVSFEQVSLEEAIDFVRQQSIELDPTGVGADSRGVNFFVDLGGADSEVGNKIRSQRINLTMRNVPLSQVLAYINEATQTIAISEPFAVRILPAGSDRSDLINKTYRVAPDFLSAAGAGGSDQGPAVNDPFADPADDGMLARQLTAEEVLRGNGVSFPEGASAAFNPANSTLRVRNTPGNHALVDQIVQAITNTEPVSVVVKMTMLKSTQTRMEELGFDWLLGDFGMSGSTFLSGGTVGNGDSLDDVQLPQGQNQRLPLTAGNRSGDSAFGADSIDEQIFRSGQGFADVEARAPGALWVNGLFDDSHVTMLMRGLDQKKGIDIMSTPSVVTRSGQTADVRVVREFIYPEEYEPPEVPNSVGDNDLFVDFGTGQVIGGGGGGQSPVTPATPTSFTMRETGTILEVLPIVSGDRNYVDLTLKPEVTEFDGFVNYGSPINTGGGGGFTILPGGAGGARLIPAPPQELTPNRILMPVFSVIRSETALTIADGQTIVIGGLFQESIETFEDKVPILGSIPLIGRLFQSNGSAPSQTAIVLMVNVRVVDAAGRPFNP